MSYTDENVYRMRKCIDIYTELALKARSSQDEYDALCKCCTDVGIDIPNIIEANASEAASNTKFRADMIVCTEAYDALAVRQKALSCAIKKMKKLLKREGVK